MPFRAVSSKWRHVLLWNRATTALCCVMAKSMWPEQSCIMLEICASVLGVSALSWSGAALRAERRLTFIMSFLCSARTITPSSTRTRWLEDRLLFSVTNWIVWPCWGFLSRSWSKSDLVSCTCITSSVSREHWHAWRWIVWIQKFVFRLITYDKIQCAVCLMTICCSPQLLSHSFLSLFCIVICAACYWLLFLSAYYEIDKIIFQSKTWSKMCCIDHSGIFLSLGCFLVSRVSYCKSINVSFGSFTGSNAVVLFM